MPSLQALARLPAEVRQHYAACAHHMEIAEPVSAATAVALRNVDFRRLVSLVVLRADGSLPADWLTRRCDTS
jgi:hypothetical protein